MLIGAVSLCTVGNLALYRVNRNLNKNWVYAIEWDLEKENFLIKSPKSALSGSIQEERVSIDEFKQTK